MSYPLFVPPEDLAQVDTRDWTRQQADRYFKWFQDGYDGRVRYLLEHLDESPDGPCEDLLERVGRKARQRLRTDPGLASLTKETLTNQGCALAADIGLLLGRCLLAAGNGRIYWEILRGGPKRLSSRNLPVLQGFRGVYVDPLQVAVIQAFAVLGERDGDAWRRIYEHWAARIPREAAPSATAAH